MKLSAAQIRHAMPQLEAKAIPDNHPAVEELKGLFGDHTFFLGDNGLQVIETGAEDDAGGLANVINVASWTDRERTALKPHEPEVTDVVVEIGPEKDNSVN